jgi:hypothetical protein
MKIPITAVRQRAPEPEDANVPATDPLALDPYSPTIPLSEPERRDADPLGLSPYSPIPRTRAPVERD